MAGILFSFFSLFSLYTVAQNDLEFSATPPAPNAAKLAQYGLIPVNLHTGAPNISVPLYQIDFDGMSLPISLSYFPGGIKANEEASWVGLGWSLNATGVVSRTIMGTDDLKQDGPRRGYVYDPDIIPQEVVEFHSDFWDHLQQDQPDTEPDIFTYNLFGTTGKFLLGKKSENNNEVVVIKIQEDPNRILFDEISQTFEITTVFGYKAVFTVKEYTTNLSGSCPCPSLGSATTCQCENQINVCDDALIDIQQVKSNGNFRTISSWYLASITSPRGEIITFDYKLNPLGNSEYVSISSPYFGEQQTFLNSGSAGDLRNTKSCSKVIHENIYLNEINYKYLSINFNSSDRTDLQKNISFTNDPGFPQNENALKNPQRLTQIVVSDNVRNQDIQVVDFSQDYFNENDPQSDPFLDWRLRLLQVTTLDQVYSFSYFDGLPSKDTKGVDYWWYYNGRDDNEYVVPAFVVPPSFLDPEDRIPTSTYYQSPERIPNFDFGKAGLLFRMDYPTGGHTIFNYEPHIYQTTESEEGNPLELLTYSVNGLSQNSELAFSYTGHFGEPDGDCPSAVEVDITIQCNECNPLNCQCSVDFADWVKTAFEIVDANTGAVMMSYDFTFLEDATQNGQHSFFIERSLFPPGDYIAKAYAIADGAGNVKYFGSANISYYNICDPQYQSVPGDPTPVNRIAGGARIESIESFSETGLLAIRRSYKYLDSNLGAGEFSSGKLMTPLRNLFSWVNPLETNLCFDCYWVLSSGSSLPNSNAAQGSHIGYDNVEEIIESTNGVQTSGSTISFFENQPNLVLPLAQTTQSFQDLNGQLTSELVLTDVGEVKSVSEFRDFSDLTGTTYGIKYSGGGGSAPVYISKAYALNSHFVQPKQVEITRHDQGTALKTTENFIYNQQFLVTQESQTASSGEIVSKNYRYPFDYLTPASTIDNMIQRHQIGEPIEVIEKVNGIEVKAVGREYQTDQNNLVPVNTHIYETSEPGAGFTSSIDGVAFPSYSQRATFHRYDNEGNVLEFSKEDDVHISYIWGYDKTKPVAELVNCSFSQVEGVLGTGFNLGSGPLTPTQDAQLRTQLPQAQITSYTYDPLVGVTSITDPRGLTTTYEYDQFNRLKLIRDHNNNIVQKYRYEYGNDGTQ